MTTQLIALTCAVREDSEVTASLDGELDVHTSAQIGPRLTRLAESWGPELTLDLSGLTFCDSAGVDLLLRIHHQCAARGIRLTLAGVPRLVAGPMRLLGADRVLVLSER
ncbi:MULTISPECIES: STAS domain-containing protein [unclassified Streptomyces]|uniref:STAS domain-containing protein n=1 Tax=unclassified Streptomyces TaxID=2593676 RepID=UPI000A414922|nr:MULTISPECIES: STAS domain-containing protein [unclassified Streptomyces]MCX5152137.1 STAS domain-containing protein [Streptomyces sp. NBC_00320]WSN53123.1 STAS domain-containing protein [Streptomyces sp. NBC_01296]WSW57368.1 STAS domain-containing protein [Streptomyces sp. NBC_00998]